VSYLFHPVGLSSKTKVENDNVHGVYDRQYSKHSESKSLSLYRKDTLSVVAAVTTATTQDISNGAAVADVVAFANFSIVEVDVSILEVSKNICIASTIRRKRLPCGCKAVVDRP